MPSPLAITVEDDGSGLVRVRLLGELDLATVPDLEARVDRVAGVRILLLDLSGLSFIDSSGLRAIIELHDRAQTEGWTLRLIHGPPEVRRVFKLTRTESWLPFV